MNSKENLKIKTATGIFWQLMEKITAQLVTLVVTIILARFLMPSDYGTIALIEVFISLFSVFVTTGFGSALIQKKDTDEEDFYSALYASGAVGVAIYMLVFFAAPSIARFYSSDSLIPIVRFMGLQIPILSVKSVETAYVAKNFMFRKFFFATLIGTVVSGFVGIFMAYSGYGHWAICFQSVGNMFIDTIVLGIIIRLPLKLYFSLKRIKVMWGFTSRMLLSSVINTIYMNIKKLIIGKKYSVNDLSFYTKGEQFPNLIANNITSTIESVFFPTLTVKQENIKSILNITRRFVQVSTYLMFPMLIGLAAIANTLIPMLLTEKWNQCIIYLQIACIVYLFNPLQIATIQPIKALGKADIYLRMEVIKKMIGLLLLLIVMNKGVLVLAFVSIAISIINWLINAITAKKIYGYKILNQIVDFLPNLILSFIMGLLVYMINYLQCIALVRIGIQIIAGVVIYVGISYVTHNSSLCYIIDFLKVMKNRGK